MNNDIVTRLRDPYARAAWANGDMYDDAASEIETLRANLEMAKNALRETIPSLAAAISLLSRSSKKAAASDKMFDMMLKDYQTSLDSGRSTYAQLLHAEDTP